MTIMVLELNIDPRTWLTITMVIVILKLALALKLLVTIIMVIIKTSNYSTFKAKSDVIVVVW